MKFKNLVYVFVTVTLLFNCSSGSDDDTSPTPNPNPNPNPSGKITYNGNIKSIMSANCTSCHGNPPTNGAPMSLTTYSQVKSAVETRGLIGRINNTNNPMPTDGLMSQANRDLIQKWLDDGLLEN
ncbi:cytochrome c [Mariniflexile sp. HNIBRBA6329]|uniref:cytochrome c n=1 Tax=Mariniflexile sp. HNIBRBA6329 TaxID=3373088 RepID=UPI0037452D1D